MQILIGIIALAIIVFLIFKKQPACATAKVIAGRGRVDVEITSNEKNPEILFALGLCYAAKIRWLILSEPPILQTIYKNVFNSTLEKWPTIPDVEMLSSLNDTPSRFVINLHFGKSNGYYITNTLPHQCPSNDIVTHYFFLLREIIGKLGANHSEMFKTALYTFATKRVFNDASVPGLIELNKDANTILKSIGSSRYH